MKRSIMAIIIIGLLLLTACGDSPELKAKKEEQTKNLNEDMVQAVDECTQLDPEEDADSLCLAEKAYQIDQLRIKYNQETGLSYRKIPFNELCREASDESMCYFYASVLLEDDRYCGYTDDRTGCELISSGEYCSSVENKEECLVDRAFMLSYLDLEESHEICSSLPPKYHVYSEDEFSCADIDFEDTDDNLTFQEKFRITYYLSSLMGFETEKVRV